MVSNEESIEKTGYIKGELLYTIFHNENEHFSIAKIKILDTNEDYHEKDIVAKGYFTNLQEETAYYFYGQFEKHLKFGMKYLVDYYQNCIQYTDNVHIHYL